MPPELTDKPWAQIRHDYEHTDWPVEDICAEHGISSGTLRDRVRRWGWTRRRPPVPREGPPPALPPPIESVALRPVPQAETPESPLPATRSVAAGEAADAADGADDRPIVPRLQSAVARLVPAIEAVVATLGAGPAHPREMERAARVLAALTRTLRELSGLLRQHEAGDQAARFDPPVDIEERRRELARKLEAFVAQHADRDEPESEPQAR